MTHLLVRLLLVSVAAVASAVHAAPGAPTVTDKQMEEAKQLLRMPTDADIEAVRRSIAPLQKKDPSVPLGPRTPAPLDPAALSAQTQDFAKAVSGQVMGAKNQPALLLFVSLSMPQESLLAYADQAEQAKATIVIRGVKDRSMRRTMEAVQKIIGERKVAWVIDPTAFDRFDVTTVPTVVLTSASLAGATCSTRECTAPGSFAKVAGEVPIDHSLQEIHRRVPALQAAAAPYIKRFASPWR
jgi:conjugal transfer pilus assembly protein TrbC